MGCAKRVYPHAVSLIETVRAYGQMLDLVENNKEIEWLVAEYQNKRARMSTNEQERAGAGTSMDKYFYYPIIYTCTHMIYSIDNGWLLKQFVRSRESST
jgi:hypothetical protein